MWCFDVDDLYRQFLAHLEKEDKYASVDFAVSLLKNKQVSIRSLYNDYLRKVLNEMEANEGNHLAIWKEHVRSGIIRTILECCYPYVVEQKLETLGPTLIGKAVVICPEGEYHELGARMVSDYFTLCGFETHYVGSSTPKEEFIAVIHAVNPDCIAIGVTNYFNLVEAQRTIELIRAKGLNTKIYVGGQAFQHNKKAFMDMGADALLESYEDIEKIAREVR